MAERRRDGTIKMSDGRVLLGDSIVLARDLPELAGLLFPGEAKGRCFYCLDDKISISVCLGCRSKQENAHEELKRVRKELEILRREHWNRMNAKKRAVKASMKGRR